MNAKNITADIVAAGVSLAWWPCASTVAAQRKNRASTNLVPTAEPRVNGVLSSLCYVRENALVPSSAWRLVASGWFCAPYACSQHGRAKNTEDI